LGDGYVELATDPERRTASMTAGNFDLAPVEGLVVVLQSRQI